MIEELKLFILIISSLYCFTHLGKFIINLFMEDPKPIKTTPPEKVLLYFSSAYILTTIILAIQ